MKNLIKKTPTRVRWSTAALALTMLRAPSQLPINPIVETVYAVEETNETSVDNNNKIDIKVTDNKETDNSLNDNTNNNVNNNANSTTTLAKNVMKIEFLDPTEEGRKHDKDFGDCTILTSEGEYIVEDTFNGAMWEVVKKHLDEKENDDSIRSRCFNYFT